MFIRDLERLDAQLWTVAIEDVWNGTMRFTFNYATQIIEAGLVPIDVIVGCQWIENPVKKREGFTNQ